MASEHSVGSLVHLTDCTIVGMTAAAFHVEWESQRFWIPKSVIEVGQREALEEGDEGVTLSIPEKMAREKNLEVD